MGAHLAVTHNSLGLQNGSHMKAFEAIKSAILAGEFSANQRLVETELARWLGLSRTPVREALRLLENLGIVDHNAGKGWVVCPITLQDIREIFEVKLVLEPFAAARAAELATAEERQSIQDMVDLLAQDQKDGNVESWLLHDLAFHELLFDCTRNERLKQTLLGLNDQWYRLRVAIVGMARRMSDSISEHRDIGECIAQGDGPRAKQVTLDHLTGVLASIEDVFRGLSVFRSTGL